MELKEPKWVEICKVLLYTFLMMTGTVATTTGNFHNKSSNAIGAKAKRLRTRHHAMSPVHQKNPVPIHHVFTEMTRHQRRREKVHLQELAPAGTSCSRMSCVDDLRWNHK